MLRKRQRSREKVVNLTAADLRGEGGTWLSRLRAITSFDEKGYLPADLGVRMRRVERPTMEDVTTISLVARFNMPVSFDGGVAW